MLIYISILHAWVALLLFCYAPPKGSVAYADIMHVVASSIFTTLTRSAQQTVNSWAK
ncbi:protein of unknown function [Shewanella benthica]|uniref:Uncharacterized protein n=1 Tax=Shewanella benthica TaxID=43661 RepID=A0A330M8D4_9GAMM|nr:protein of unknown function [Shewanella benthica]